MRSHWTGDSTGRVARFLRKHGDSDEIDGSTLLSELKLDSLDLIECVFELEQHYGVMLSNAELASLMTLEDLLNAFSSEER